MSNRQINRELTILKRAFTLAIQGRGLYHKLHIPLLQERNTRTGFLEPEQFTAVKANLPEALRPVIEFACITGWRVASEALPLQWRNVDFAAGEIRIDAHCSKNGEPRVFPMTDDLRRLFETQQAAHVKLKRIGKIVPWVFFRMVAEKRGGEKHPKRILSLTKAWNSACEAAGCPGRIPHDLRRTAIRAMVRRGVPERVAMKLSGHKTRSIFERYNVVSPGDLRAAAQQLSGLTGTKKGQSTFDHATNESQTA